MGECPGRKNPESRCDGGQKLPEQRGNELSGAHRVALSGLCRVAGRTENPHEHGGLGKASGRLFGVQRQRVADRPGKISAEQAKLHAETEYEKYRVVQDRLYESDFDRFMMLEEKINNSKG